MSNVKSGPILYENGVGRVSLEHADICHTITSKQVEDNWVLSVRTVTYEGTPRDVKVSISELHDIVYKLKEVRNGSLDISKDGINVIHSKNDDSSPVYCPLCSEKTTSDPEYLVSMRGPPYMSGDNEVNIHVRCSHTLIEAFDRVWERSDLLLGDLI